jgi:hypothetical protein
VDVSFNVQIDPTKTTINATQLRASLESRVGKGNYSYDEKTGEVKIFKTGAQSLMQYDPFYGFNLDQKRALNFAASKVYKGAPEEILYMDRTKDGVNLKFRIIKAGDNLYYLKSDKGTILTSGDGTGLQPFTSVEQLGRTIRTLCQKDYIELKPFLNQ